MKKWYICAVASIDDWLLLRLEKTYNTNIKIERARVEKSKMNYLYSQGDSYVFMNNETYEQLEIPESKLADKIKFLKLYTTWRMGCK